MTCPVTGSQSASGGAEYRRRTRPTVEAATLRCGPGAAGPIDESGLSFRPPPAPPLVSARPGDTHLRGHVRRWAPGGDPLDQDQPPSRSQPSISVGHERPPRSEWMPSDSSTDPEV